MENILEEAILTLLEYHASGSGIDCKWVLRKETTNKLYFSNSFHCMNDHGYYDGYQDFSVVVDKRFDTQEFILQFNGDRSRLQKYVLREYLEDTIAYALGADLDFVIPKYTSI